MNTPEWLEAIKQKRERAMLSSLAHHKDVTALLQLVEKQREALEKARHDLVTSNNLLATDRPDLVNWPENLCWMTNQKTGIEAIDEALLFKPKGVEA